MAKLLNPKDGFIMQLWHVLMREGLLCNCALEDKYARFECRDCAEGLSRVRSIVEKASAKCL